MNTRAKKLGAKQFFLWRQLLERDFDAAAGKGKRKKWKNNMRKRPYEYYIERHIAIHPKKEIVYKYIYKNNIKYAPTLTIERWYETQREERLRLKKEKRFDKKHLKKQKMLTRYGPPKPKPEQTGGFMQLLCFANYY